MDIIVNCETGKVEQRKPAPKTMAQRREELLLLAAARRYERETSGVSVGDFVVGTDRQTTAILTAAYVRASADTDYKIRWKAGSGTFVELTSPQIIAIANAVAAHVQASFDWEAEVVSAIMGAKTHADPEDAIDLTAAG